MKRVLDPMPRKPTLAESVAEHLKEYIASMRLMPGDRLPSQDELAAQLGVSRNVVREAIKGLEMIGILESRHGGGVFVAAFDARPLANSLAFRLNGIDPRQRLQYLFEARERFELCAVDLAVQRMNDEDIARLEEELALMEEIDTADRSLVLDWAFHRTLLESAHNPIISCFADILQELFRMLVESQPPAHNPEPAVIAQRHRELFRELVSRDPDRARAALRNHIAVSKQRWLD